MGKIQQLSAHVADLIAAGEVVERPASAAKELVENAIDAGAKNITVEIQGGGMSFLRVTDDGCGMSPEDAETAFLRHATSKLRTAADLEAITTLGFRGEALAAISSVSRIDLLTKTPDAPFGCSLHLEAGQITEKSEAGCPTGTTIIVRDLFYNTPARMKFMKRDSVEAAALLAAVQRLALAHPEISFRVLRDGEEQLRTVGDGKLQSAIYAVMGKTTAKEMLPLKSAWEKYSLSGFVSTPTASRGNRANEVFFVNGRHVRSKTMTAALEEAYRNRIMVGRFPSCVLHLELPEHLVDVNVHPAKIEVKFLNERDVFDCVMYGVKGALEQAGGRVELKMKEPAKATELRTSPAPASAQTSFGGSFVRPQTTAQTAATAKPIPRQDFYQKMTAEEFHNFAEILKTAPMPTEKSARAAVQAVLEQHQKQQERTNSASKEEVKKPQAVEEKPAPSVAEQTAAPQIQETPIPLETVLTTAQKEISLPQPQVQEELSLGAEPYTIVGETLNTYILVEQKGELLFIDKHAAHERILFEKLRSRQEPVMPQLLLQPILCKLGAEEAATLAENDSFLSEFGFVLSDFGDGVLSVSQIPTEIDPSEVEAVLSQLASDLLKGKRTDQAALRDELLHTIACKAAIKGGWHTDKKELEALVAEVMSREDLKYCPHGRPICARLTKGQLERQFKRS